MSVESSVVSMELSIVSGRVVFVFVSVFVSFPNSMATLPK